MIRTTATWIIASWAIAVGTCWSADDFKPWPRNVKPARDYYDYLSDNEFDSLMPGPIFYTFFIDEWRQRPLTNKFFSIASSRFSRDADVVFQERVFPNFKDVRFLGRAVNELSQANSRTAVTVLKKALTFLEDARLRNDVLRTLAKFRATYPQGDLKQLMESKDHHVRGGASALYAVQSYSKSAQLLTMAASESGPRKLRLIELAATCSDCGAVTQWEPYLKDEAEAIKAVPGVARSKGAELEAVLQTLSRHASAPVRFALASNYRQWPKSVTSDLLRRLSKDPLSSIRGTVAEAIGKGRHEALVPELFKLAASTPASVRAKAAVSLRQFPDDAPFATLTTLTGDPRFNVRDSAKDSMLAMSGKYDVDADLAANMRHKNPFIRFNAYLVSAALKSTRHAKLLATAVPKEKDPEILAAGMEAWVIAGGDESRTFILRQAKHKSVLVRISVVRAIGRQRWTEAYPILSKCVLNDGNEPEYRRMALVAMGWTQNNAFSKELLWTLKNVLKSSADQRAAAAWAAARLPKPSSPLIGRLYTQVVAKVIPGPPPSYDSKNVRISCTFTLKILAQNGIQDAVRPANGAMSSLDNSGMGDAPGGPDYPFYASQINNFLNKKPIGGLTAKPLRYIFSFRPARRSTEK